MEIMRTARPTRDMADVKIWHCAGCGVVHMSVREMVINFDRDEFSAFTEQAVDIHYSGWQGREGSIIDLVDHDSDVSTDAVFH